MIERGAVPTPARLSPSSVAVTSIPRSMHTGTIPLRPLFLAYAATLQILSVRLSHVTFLVPFRSVIAILSSLSLFCFKISKAYPVMFSLSMRGRFFCKPSITVPLPYHCHSLPFPQARLCCPGYYSTITSVPAAMSTHPMADLTVNCSCRKIAASIMVKTTLSLSIGTTLDTSPI